MKHFSVYSTPQTHDACKLGLSAGIRSVRPRPSSVKGAECYLPVGMKTQLESSQTGKGGILAPINVVPSDGPPY